MLKMKKLNKDECILEKILILSLPPLIFLFVLGLATSEFGFLIMFKTIIFGVAFLLFLGLSLYIIDSEQKNKKIKILFLSVLLISLSCYLFSFSLVFKTLIALIPMSFLLFFTLLF